MNPFRRIRDGFRTTAGLHRWALEPSSANRAAADARQLLTRRSQRFLSLMREAVYGYPRSPYLKLLRHAGCDYGALESEVTTHGLETTLQRLAAEGVYVTHDEMKGREGIRRGSAVFHFSASDFNNPLLKPHFEQTSSGSTGAATTVGISLDHFREQLIHTALSAEFHDLTAARVAIWVPPSEWSVSRAMRLAKVVGRVDRWFTQLSLPWASASIAQSVSIRALVSFLRLYGVHLPVPIHVPMVEPGLVVDWLAGELRHGRVLLVTYPATAARACGFAARTGVSLEGAVFLIGGEPVTRTKRLAVESTGARCLPLFGCTETGESAEGCLSPCSSDDMHLYEHKFALITRRLQAGPEEEFDTPLFTTLSPHTPNIFLNGDTGDVGVVEQRDCGCPWGQLGFRTHLRDVWSYSKLTAEGMTLPGEAVFDVLEQLMPKRFGGRADDYQLVTEPAPDGVTRYLLAISPSLGPIDEEAAARTFCDALAPGSYWSMAVFLRQAGQLQVVRRPPALQSAGKSLPVMLQRPNCPAK